MAKLPRCPVCGARLRVKPGERNRLAPAPLWQCKAGVTNHPAEGFEWTNATVQLLHPQPKESDHEPTS